ncbi:MAG: Rieske (2Fe-2S) protein [Acidobacteria bacterium]|nr:Rieske (2Fe-2S) protein [Acidobacteriota bacterium]
MPRFVKVVKVNEMPPGTAREFQADGKMIALYNVDGNIYATDNVCLHRGGPLGQGTLEGEVVTCPWHGWQYRVSSGEAVFNEQIKVQTLPVKVEGEDIWVGLET